MERDSRFARGDQRALGDLLRLHKLWHFGGQPTERLRDVASRNTLGVRWLTLVTDSCWAFEYEYVMNMNG